ncbi:MAG: sigma 54-interacting transcriptional regulator [Desulfovibrio sp.]|jgi:PAS domain S-box-containing protein|nr:sigma 54-interacting transcriptional regulator [Desulfovibrio sp.]
MSDTFLFENSSLIAPLLSAISEPVVGIDPGGVIRLCNEAMLDVLGKEQEEILGRPVGEVIEGSRLMQVIRGGQPERWRKFAVNGHSFLVNRAPLVVDGRTVGALATLHEISDLEQISAELKSVRELKEELEGIIESAFDGIYVTDAEGVTLRVNNGYLRITGLRKEDVIGYSMFDLVANKVFDSSATIKVLETGKSATLIQKINNGATVMVSGNPLRSASGTITRVVTTVRDLTELNRLRDELGIVGNLKNRCEAELKELKQKNLHQGEIIVRSAPMQSVLDLSSRLSTVDSTVLIHGESGVGKELIAEYIHHNSQRKDKPFIKINCTAIPETLLESELFGYVRGAFTGANKEGRPGLFEAADGGTLLLDEVGDLPMPLQVKLLRVIQERQTRRIGDNTPRFVDVRLIAATNHDLTSLVERKLFREDLYYRLNVVPIHVPPLRERKEDIIFMVQSFLKNFCKRHKREKSLHPAVMPCLLDHPWPGNVRELANMVERLVVTSPGPVITLQDLPPFLRRQHPQPVMARPLEGETLKDILENVEAEILRDALARYRSTRKAARALGIDQSSVVRKARRLGLSLRRSLPDPENDSP